MFGPVFLLNFDLDIEIIDSHFEGNVLRNSGNVSLLYGAGLEVDGFYSSLLVDDCTFENNVFQTLDAVPSPDNLIFGGAGLAENGVKAVEIRNSLFRDNFADVNSSSPSFPAGGGALYLSPIQFAR